MEYNWRRCMVDVLVVLSYSDFVQTNPINVQNCNGNAYIVFPGLSVRRTGANHQCRQLQSFRLPTVYEMNLLGLCSVPGITGRGYWHKDRILVCGIATFSNGTVTFQDVNCSDQYSIICTRPVTPSSTVQSSSRSHNSSPGVTTTTTLAPVNAKTTTARIKIQVNASTTPQPGTCNFAGGFLRVPDYDGYFSKTDVLETSKTFNEMLCARQCLKHGGCRAFFYDVTSATCQVLSSSVRNNGEMETREGAKYYVRN